MTGKRLGVTAVCDGEMIKGIITDGDLRRMLQSEGEVGHLTAKDIMTPNPISIAPDALAYEAFTKMRNKSISHILVGHKGQYLGVLHIHDFIREGFI